MFVSYGDLGSGSPYDLAPNGTCLKKAAVTADVAIERDVIDSWPFRL
jgi:hypothetical protein